MEKINLVMPMAGEGSRFSEMGYNEPKPLLQIRNKPFFYWAIKSITDYVNVEKLICVVLQKHIDEWKIDEKIKKYFPEAIIIVLPKTPPGPVLTCLESLREIEKGIVIFNDCDHKFKSSELNSVLFKGQIEEDAALLSFESSEPQFSYIQFDENGTIVGTKEKKVVSDRAICGAYLFKNKEVFYEASMDYIKKCPYKEAFMSGVYNILCEREKRIKHYCLDYHIEYGTPAEYEQNKDSEYFE